ncbi:C40 family peptidase [Salipaludibacillus daqingensis]|uniref:C40 family peptidase n=1 Tax=Salipaludibacillus daqingensis TaxID=3041001 RepID=UPI002474ABE3|nr:C40 family peptidase [Salipaludibacillus daqingensis]
MGKQKKRLFDPLTALMIIGIIFAILILTNAFGSGDDSDNENNDIESTETVGEISNDSQPFGYDIDTEPVSDGIIDSDFDFSIEEFIKTAENLESTLYESGGKDPEEGFNSSGFVQYVYEEATGIRMPRIAGHQKELGEKVGNDFLQEGDVVFFEASTLMSGIYIGNNEFMTATESEGIAVLPLENDSFWGDNYIGAKRLTKEEMTALHPSSYSNHDHPIVSESMNYLGTPYEFGGNSLEAFDCSFFIQEVFRETMDVYLPRVTIDQYKVGDDIPEEDLRPGDVLYFSDVDVETSDREEGEITHAGIYVGNNYMIHSSRTEDMTQISFLNDYWKDAFTGVKRFDNMSLNDEAPLVQEAASYLTTPFKSGGSTPEDGFNTTGFVTYVFEKSRGQVLPDNSRDIQNSGTEVNREDLEPEDIVFFESGGNLLPGIYIGHDQFIIATESSGVTTRHLDHGDFFSDKYVGAKRY